MKTSTISILLAGAICLPLAAQDWPQYRGPNHDGTSPEKISTHWPDAGLKQNWKTPLHNGFSAFATGDGKVFTLETRQIESVPTEVLVALDAGTGKEIWFSPLGLAHYDGGGDSGAKGNDGGDGPRSTPAYDNGKVYAYSALMLLKCVNAADGKDVWSCDILKEHAGRNIHWQDASSPLIDGNLVFVAGGGPGESLLAFDKTDGHLVWKGQDDKMTQSTPVAATILGTRQIIFYTQNGLVSVAPATGAVLWRGPFPMTTGAAAISPVVSGDMIYCSMSYNVGSTVVKISKNADDTFKATEVWRVRGNDESSHWSTPVAANGYIYGIFKQAQFGTAPLECVDMATGEVKWSHPGFGPGGVTLVDGNLLVLSDAGDLVLAKAAPDAYTELARAHVLTGKCWNAVAISNGRIYARSTKEGVSLDVPN